MRRISNRRQVRRLLKARSPSVSGSLPACMQQALTRTRRILRALSLPLSLARSLALSSSLSAHSLEPRESWSRCVSLELRYGTWPALAPAACSTHACTRRQSCMCFYRRPRTVRRCTDTLSTSRRSTNLNDVAKRRERLIDVLSFLEPIARRVRS